MEKDHLVGQEIVEQMDVRETVVGEETEELLVQREKMAETGTTEGMVSLVQREKLDFQVIVGLRESLATAPGPAEE